MLEGARHLEITEKDISKGFMGLAARSGVAI